MLRTLFVIAATVFIYCSGSGQKPILSSPVDSGQIRLLFKTSKRYINKSDLAATQTDKNLALSYLYLDSAMSILKNSLPVSESLRMHRLSNEIYCRIGLIYIRRENMPEGRKWITNAFPGYSSAANEIEEADLLFVIAREFPATLKRLPYLDSVLQRAIKIYTVTNQTEKLAKTTRLSADHHFNLGLFSRCEAEYLSVINLYRLLKKNNTSDVYLYLSSLNRYKGNFDRSISYSLKCLQQTEQGKDTVPLSTVYSELALVYDGLDQKEESITWYRKALLEREKTITKEGPLFTFRTAGFLIQQLIKVGKEKEALSIIIDLSKKYPPTDPLIKSLIAQNLGYCYEAMKEYATAEKQFLEMIKQGMISWRYGEFDEFLSIAHQDIGGFYIRRHQYGKATSYLDKATNVIPGTNSLTRQKDLQLMLFTADSAEQKYLPAIKHFRQYSILKDSLFNETKSRQIEEIQIQYATEKKEKEIILLNEQRKSQESQIQKSAIIRNFIILGILLLCGFFYYRYHIKQRSNRQLQLQQVEINQKNRTLQSLVNEKEWLLREIHHRVKNNLQVIMALLESQSIYLENNSPALKAIQDSQHRVHAMSLIHKKLYKSDNVSSINMLVYIHELVEYLRDSFHTEQGIYFEIDVEQIDLDISQAVPLGLMMNEAITNSIKYAFPGKKDGKISISMKEISDDTFLLQIADNGIGFPDDINTSKLESLGLSLMKGLSEEIDGNFSIESNHGTVIKIQFSIDHQIFHSKNNTMPLPIPKNTLS